MLCLSFLVAFVALFSGVSGFIGTGYLRHCLHCAYINRALCQTVQDDADDIHMASSSPPASKTVEFWLDLRGTAVYPGSAMSILSDNVDENIETIIDRVILSPETMDKIISKQQQADDDQRSFLYVPSKSDDLVVSDPKTRQSLPCGKVIRSEPGALFNPVLALDIVVTNGGWVLLECSDKIEERVFLDEVNGLMTFLVGSSSTTSSLSLNGGLLLGDGNEQDNSSVYNTVAGSGMAVSCLSRNLLVEVSKFALSLASIPGGSSTSPGGIILPNNNVADINNNELVLIEGDIFGGSSGGSQDQPLPLAVVLPLDMKLWKTAMELVADTEYYLEEEEEY